MKVLGRKIPLSALTTSQLQLYGVSDEFLYQDGTKTDTVVGKKYDIGIVEECDRIKVKVPIDGATITKEDIANTKSKLFVTFSDCFGTIYRSKSGEAEFSFTATAISVAK